MNIIPWNPTSIPLSPIKSHQYPINIQRCNRSFGLVEVLTGKHKRCVGKLPGGRTLGRSNKDWSRANQGDQMYANPGIFRYIYRVFLYVCIHIYIWCIHIPISLSLYRFWIYVVAICRYDYMYVYIYIYMSSGQHYMLNLIRYTN